MQRSSKEREKGSSAAVGRITAILPFALARYRDRMQSHGPYGEQYSALDRGRGQQEWSLPAVQPESVAGQGNVSLVLIIASRVLVALKGVKPR